MKMSGCGNDFVLVDASKKRLTGDLAELARKICARHTGVGADGLFIIEPDKEVDFSVRMFNADGSEPEMCGNASRCLARFAKMCGVAGEKARFRTTAGIIEAEVRKDDVRIRMTPPRDVRAAVTLKLKGGTGEVAFVNTGVPHAVMFVEDVKTVDVVGLGREIRHHEKFAPAGTNVDFVQVMGPKRLKMRTYERGVEDETLACGTGAVAAGVLARLAGKVKGESVAVEVEGGVLTVTVEMSGEKPSGATLAGEARVVFRGVTEEL